MKKVVIDGNKINTEKELHQLLSKELDFGPYYGENLDALWDMLTTNIERPFSIYWVNLRESRKKLGSTCDQIVNLLKDVEEYDLKMGWTEKFSFNLEE